jgi:hypothetical protein
MNTRRLSVFLALGAALLLALALLVPLAGAATTRPGSSMMGASGTTWGSGMMGRDGNWCGGGFWNGGGSTWGGSGMWGTGYGAQWLRSHPGAFDAWLRLRTDQMTEMRAWFQQYKGDLRSPAAQQALRSLWQDHWNDMKAFYQQYGGGAKWVCPALGMWGGGMMGSGQMMWGTGYGSGWLLQHPAAFAGWQQMRARQISQVSAWWSHHRAQPFSAAAQKTLTAMRSHHKTQALAYMRGHHVSGSTAWSYRGWMGLGGTWGGWGW